MQIGDYKIGVYPAIIKIIFTDGTCKYETDFDDADDLQESVAAWQSIMLDFVQLSTGQYVDDVMVIEGVDQIRKELDFA